MQFVIILSGVKYFEPGLASRLLDKKPLLLKILSEANYGCSHCVKVGEGHTGAKPMTVNGLRSHLKAKCVFTHFETFFVNSEWRHRIEDFRDEDVFCFKPVDWLIGTFKGDN